MFGIEFIKIIETTNEKSVLYTVRILSMYLKM